MDIKEKVEELVKKITSSKDLTEKFSKDPVKVVEGLLGIDLPDETVKKIVEGVKAKVTVDKIGGVADALKNIFSK